MLIEALAPLLVKVAGHRFTLEPGKPVELSEERALRLLAKAPGKVRLVARASLAALRPGALVVWDSPLFGTVTGEVLACLEDGRLEVWHPLTGKLARIPREWVRGTESQEKER